MTIITRKAEEGDLPFIKALALRSLPYGVPENRKPDCREWESTIDETIDDLMCRQEYQGDAEILIAFDRESGITMGYLILMLDERDFLTGERQAFIQDIAVERKYWGRHIPRILIEAAVEKARRAGLPYLAGLVSKNNTRALGTAVKGLGFQIERYQVVRRL